jgi:putative ABC transport system permease protein
VAVSRALGASGTAIVRAMLLEGALLGLLGGLGGVLAGRWGMRLLVALGPTDLPRRDDIVLDWRVALVVVTVGVLLGLAAAASPAAWASRVPLESLVATGSLRGTRTYGRLRRSLIVVQVALSLVLLSAGGLVVRSFERLLTVDPGFRPAGVLTFQVSLGRWLFPAEADAFAFQDRVTDAFRSVPGVTAVSATRTLPIAGGTNVTALTIPGAPGNTGDANRDTAIVDRIFVRSGYVDAIGIRVLAGRAFAGGHGPGVREALIDRALARQFFPTGEPIGASIRCEGQTLVIIGVIEQARMYDLYRDGRPQLLVRAEDYEGRRPSYFVVHTNGDPRALSALVTPIVRRVDRRVAVSDVRTMNEIVAERRSRERLSAVLIGGLALGALVLVAMGLVGVISGTVTRRRGELAIRMALGATHRRVLRLVVGDGALLVGLGVLLGVPGVYAAGALVRGLLVDVSPWDPATLVAVAAGLFLVALAACYAPARRVLRIDPAPLLRQE